MEKVYGLQSRSNNYFHPNILCIANLVSTDEVNAYYFSAFCVSFLNYMVHALCAFILFKIALLLGAIKKQAYLVSIFFGLTSYSFVFAQSTYEHHFEMFFILLSVYFAHKKRYESCRSFIRSNAFVRFSF
jgi:hypothetical protein